MNFQDRSNPRHPLNILNGQVLDLLAILDDAETHRRTARVQVYQGLRECAHRELVEMKDDLDAIRTIASGWQATIEQTLKQ